MSAMSTLSVESTTSRTSKSEPTAKEGLLEVVGPFLVSIAFVLFRLSFAVLAVLLAASEALVQAFSAVLDLHFVKRAERSSSIAMTQGISMLRLRIIEVLGLRVRDRGMSGIRVLACRHVGWVFLLLILLMLRLIPVKCGAEVVMTILLAVTRVFLQHTRSLLQVIIAVRPWRSVRRQDTAGLERPGVGRHVDEECGG